MSVPRTREARTAATERASSIEERAEAFRRAEHEIALEGSTRKVADVPECVAVIKGEMTTAQANEALRRRYAV